MKTPSLLLQRLLPVAAVLMASLVALSCGDSPADEIFNKSGPSGIIFVREPSQNDPGRNPMESNANESFPGTDLYLLSPISTQGDLHNLTEQYTRAGQTDSRRYGMACDPEISYDGRKVLFSMRKNTNERWRIYEMNVDGTNLVQLTNDNRQLPADLSNASQVDDMDPQYLPNGQVMFTSTRSGILDEYERRQSPLLRVGDRLSNGTLGNIRQVSFNQSHDTNPIVMSSGKVVFSRWEHLGGPNKFPLFVMNPDGSRLFVFYGNHSPSQSGSRVFLEPRELSDGGLVCSVMERNSPFEGGAIALIDISKSDDNLTWVTPTTAPFNNTGRSTSALYKTPYPILDGNDEKILFAMSPIPIDNGSNDRTADYGIYVMDKDGNNVKLLYNDPAYNEYDAVPVAKREDLPGGVPRVIPMDPNVAEGLANGDQTGIFFDGNVYDRATTDGQTRPDANFQNDDGSTGQARFLRVLEAVPLPRGGNTQIGNTEFEKQRVVGYAPIRSDGSFAVRVPANRSLHMQTLDQNGMMLVNQLTWVQVMPGERRLCTGCHDSHNRDRVINDFHVEATGAISNTALSRVYDAGFQNANDVMAHPAARTDTVDFFTHAAPNRQNAVQAILDNRCASCHGASSPAGGLRLLTVSDSTGRAVRSGDGTTPIYQTLAENNAYRTAQNQNIELVTSSGSRNSPLLWVLYNRQLNRTDNRDFRSVSYDHRDLWTREGNGFIDVFRPENHDLLSLIEWVDAGIQFTNTVR